MWPVWGMGSSLKHSLVVLLQMEEKADFSTAPFDFAQGPVEMTDLVNI
jgi:hypothetical protein